MGAEVPKPDTAAPGLAAVIGKNARRLRTNAGLTLDQVSIAARMRGLNWSESRVADFESGRVAANLATLIAFCLALADAGCAEATFPELLCSELPIQINDSLLVSNEQVVNLLSGRPAGEPNPLPPPELVMAAVEAFDAAATVAAVTKASGATEERTRKALNISLTELADWSATVAAVTKASGATEERTRKALNISLTELADWSAALWKRTFSQERDRRAGEGANAQRRGQVSRQMRAELRAAIEAATHGDRT